MRTVLVLVALVSGACSNTPSSPSPAGVTGTWNIIQMQRPADPFVLLPPEGYQVRFETSRVFAGINCNTCSGPFMHTGSSLVIGPELACTRVACSTAGFETITLEVLAGAHEIVKDVEQPRGIIQTDVRREITLSSSRGTMILRRQ